MIRPSVSLLVRSSLAIALVTSLGRAARSAELPVSRELVGHTDSVYRVVFTPDGRLVASGGFDGTVRLWSAADGREVAVLRGHRGRVLALAAGPGATLFSGGEDGKLRQWTIAAGPPARLTGHAAAARCLAVSGDGRWLLSGAVDRRLVLRDRRTNRVDLVVEDLPSVPRAVAIAPDGSWAAAALQDRTVRFWSLVDSPPPPDPGRGREVIAAGSEWRYRKGRSEPPVGWTAIDFDDSGWERGASGFGYSSNAEELTTVKTRLDDMRQSYLTVCLRHAFRVEDPGAVTAIRLEALIDDGLIVSLNGVEVARHNVEGKARHDTGAQVAGEPEAKVFDLIEYRRHLRNGLNVLAIQGHNANPTSSDFVLTPVLCLAERPADEVRPPGRGEPFSSSARLAGNARALAIAEDGERVAVAVEGDTARWLAARTGERLGGLPSPPGRVDAVAISGRGVVAAGGEGRGWLWNLERKRLVRSLLGEGRVVSRLALDTTGRRLVIAASDGAVEVWSAETGRLERRLEGAARDVTALDFGGAGQWVVAGCGGGSILAWDAGDGKSVARLSAGSRVLAVAAHRDGHVYSTHADGSILDWRTEPIGLVRELDAHDGPVRALALTAQGGLLASAGGDGGIRLWDPERGRERRSIRDAPSPAFALAWTADGEFLAAAGHDPTVRLIDPENGRVIRSLRGAGGTVLCLAFSPDGRRLLAGGTDGRLRAWKPSSGELVVEADAGEGWWVALPTLGDGRAIAADHGGGLRVWRLGGDDGGGPGPYRPAPGGALHDLSLSPDGRWLAIAGVDGVVRIATVRDLDTTGQR